MSNERWLLAPYEEMVERGERFDRLVEQYTADGEKDCTDAVHDADENRITRALIGLGNQARRLRETGLDDKVAFVDAMCLRMDLIIRDYAVEQAARAIERGDNAGEKP